MGDKGLDQFFESLRQGFALSPIEKNLEKVDQEEKHLIDIRNFNDSSKIEVDGIDRNNYEGKWAQLKKPLIENNSFTSKLVRYNFDLRPDLDAYYVAYEKYDEMIYGGMRNLRDYKKALLAKKERIVAGEEETRNKAGKIDQIQNDDAIKKRDEPETKKDVKELETDWLKRLCRKYAKKYELELSKTVPRKLREKIYNDIIKEGYETTFLSVSTTLRAIGFSKKKAAY